MPVELDVTALTVGLWSGEEALFFAIGRHSKSEKLQSSEGPFGAGVRRFVLVLYILQLLQYTKSTVL